MDGIGILVCFMAVGGLGGLLLGLARQAKRHQTDLVPSAAPRRIAYRHYNEDGTIEDGFREAYQPAQQAPVVYDASPASGRYQPGWGTVAAAGAAGYVARGVIERHHHRKVEAAARFQADMDRIVYQMHHQPASQPVQPWDAAGADFRPYWHQPDNGTGY
jgi:hypothetical protein